MGSCGFIYGNTSLVIKASLSNCSHFNKFLGFLLVIFSHYRVGVASFITLLVQKVTTDIKPFTSTLLKLLLAAVLEEKSKAAKRAFAAACAMVLKYAGPSQAQKLIEDTAALHLGERTAQISCAILLRNYSNFATDIVSGYHAVIVPVTFVSRFVLASFICLFLLLLCFMHSFKASKSHP